MRPFARARRHPPVRRPVHLARSLGFLLAVAAALAARAEAQTPTALLVEDRLTAEMPGASHFYGQALAMSADWLAVGAPDDEPFGIASGSVHLYGRDVLNGWVLTDVIVAPDGAFGDRFGSAVALGGTRLAVSAPTEDARDISDADFLEGELLGGRVVAPWHAWLDEAKYRVHVDAIEQLPIEVIASCHAPAIRGDRIKIAFDTVRMLPSSEAWIPFTHSDLEQWLAAMEPDS